MPYDQDLAYIHDAGFTDLARNAAAVVLKLLRNHKLQNGLIVDLGCGSGVLAERLTRAGYDVLGVDVSESMLKLARKRAPTARFVRGSLFRTKLPTCVAVTAIGECINYLFDRRGADQLADFFQRVYRALTPRGVFVLDVAQPGHVSKPPLLHSEGKDWAILVTKEEDARRRVLTRRMTIFRKVGRRYRRSQEVHEQRLFPLAQIVSALESAGFDVTRVSGYGSERFAPGRAGFVALKR